MNRKCPAEDRWRAILEEMVESGIAARERGDITVIRGPDDARALSERLNQRANERAKARAAGAKRDAGEPTPSELIVKRAVTVREPTSRAGYDTTDIAAAVRQMADDIRSGRMEATVQKDLAAVRRLFGRN